MRRLLAALWVLGWVGPARSAETPPDGPAVQHQPALENDPSIGLTDDEKLAHSNADLLAMHAVLKRTLLMMKEARANKDVLKMNCVAEKLIPIQGLMRISEQAGISLQEAVSRHLPRTTSEEFLRIRIAREKVDHLGADADSCIGQLAFLTDPNFSIYINNPISLPAEDLTSPALPPPSVVSPPPSSPSL